MHDGSNVYGSDEEESADLRVGKGGLLKTYKPDGPGTLRDLLPQDEDKEECEIPEQLQDAKNEKCFVAGMMMEW